MAPLIARETFFWIVLDFFRPVEFQDQLVCIVQFCVMVEPLKRELVMTLILDSSHMCEKG
jgi:hypothetical protein